MAEKGLDFIALYYSGHGIPDPENQRSGDPYIVPVDARLELGSRMLIRHNRNPAVQAGFQWKYQGTELFCRIPREAGGGPSAMRARPDEVYASRRAPAMRAESCNCNFQVNEVVSTLEHKTKDVLVLLDACFSGNVESAPKMYAIRTATARLPIPSFASMCRPPWQETKP